MRAEGPMSRVQAVEVEGGKSKLRRQGAHLPDLSGENESQIHLGFISRDMYLMLIFRLPAKRDRTYVGGGDIHAYQ